MTFFFTFLKLLCEVLSIAIFLRAILPWFSPGINNILVSILYQVTEPILVPLRRIIPRVGVMDLSPLVAIVVLQLIAYLIP